MLVLEVFFLIKFNRARKVKIEAKKKTKVFNKAHLKKNLFYTEYNRTIKKNIGNNF